ncbi:GyrI-like domain-containing protein [Spirosoma endbachense]|uniref:AraC family transcriptional regulator n=1 Tax=Spirosoma endbachense TaxID=2666025 RepID=A0A6P1VWA2_9BACT|nr:GyrI-like domain-containing protein [Spirosoma endbachense]QHV96914.1 AraC family transcriptional regulator [Spirosoma endbachense]
MATQTGKPFNIIGISVKTTNENGKAGNDIPVLWDKFMSEGILSQIPNKIDDTIYCVYTDYEKDYTRPYTTILACAVSTLEAIPDGMIGRTIGDGKYMEFTTTGNLQKGIVFDAWTKIWRSSIPRAYTADFEVYGVKAQNPDDAEVAIFIAID